MNASALAAPLRRIDRWLLAPAPAARLAVLRIAAGGYALANVVISTGEFARLADRPASEFEPVGLAGYLSGPVSPPVLWALFVISVLSGAAFVVGAAYRVVGPTFALATLGWATYHASWGQMLHFEHLVTLHLLVLGFSPAADALSWDSRGKPESSGVRYGWPIRLLAIMTVVTFALAAVAKIRVSGSAWTDGTTLANHIAYSATRLDLLGEPRPPLASIVIRHEWIVGPMALAGLGVELLAPVALLGGWFRRVWVPSVLLFHVGTLTTMFVFFPYSGLGFALLPLYRVEELVNQLRRSTIGRRLAGGSRSGDGVGRDG